MSLIRFPKRNPYHWFFIGETSSSFYDLLTFRGHPLTPIHSEEELTGMLLQFQPSFIFVEAGVSWGDPIEILKKLQVIPEVPKVLVLQRTGIQKRKALIKKAYELGVLEVLLLPLEPEEWSENLSLFMQISERVLPY